MPIERIGAVTLMVSDMVRAVEFYEKCGFREVGGGPVVDFASFRIGDGYLNLMLANRIQIHPWGRVIFYVDNVDEHYQRLLAAGLKPEHPPRDAGWDERYFHISDPDGHELSFAIPLPGPPPDAMYP